jgi:hypothetical protein
MIQSEEINKTIGLSKWHPMPIQCIYLNGSWRIQVYRHFVWSLLMLTNIWFHILTIYFKEYKKKLNKKILVHSLQRYQWCADVTLLRHFWLCIEFDAQKQRCSLCNETRTQEHNFDMIKMRFYGTRGGCNIELDFQLRTFWLIKPHLEFVTVLQ